MSNSIYSDQHHYVYQITEINTNMKYIGVRTSKNQPICDLGVKYFSSSKNKKFIRNQKKYPSNYKYEILSVHETRELAMNEEIRLHLLYKVDESDEYFNIAKQTSVGFESKGHISVMDTLTGETFRVRCDDPKYINGDYVGVMKNKVCVIDEYGKYIHVSKDDHNYLNGSYKGVNHGKITVIDNDGNTFQVSNDDPRYINGELVGFAKGKVNVKDKRGNMFQVDKDDPRYVSGELVSVNRGRVIVRDENGKSLTVSIDDPRYINGDYKGQTSGMCKMMNINTKDIKMMSYDDDMVLNGEYVTKYSYMLNGVYYKNVNDIKTSNLSEIYGLTHCGIMGRFRSKNYPDWIIIKNY